MSDRKKIYIQLFLSAFFWGGSAIASKLLMRDVQPALATFLRFFTSTLILLFAFRFLSKVSLGLSLKEHIKLFLLGVVGITFCYYCFFKGLFFSSAFNAALIEATIPMITLFIAVTFRKESFNLSRFTGFAIAYLGIVIIVSKMKLQNLITLSFNIGDVLLLLSTVCFGLYNVMYKHFNLKIPLPLQTYYIFLYGSLALIPWLLSDTDSLVLSNLSIVGVFSIAFLSIGSSILAYLFFNRGIKALGASKASGFINYVPIISILLTLIVLKETIAIHQVIGASIVLFGTFISYRKEKEYTK